MAKTPLTLEEIKSILEEIFRYTVGIAGNDGHYPKTRMDAAVASAEIANVLLGIHEFFAALEDLDDDGSDGPDPHPSGPEDDWERLAPVTEAVGSERTDLSGAEEGSDHDDGFPSEPE